LEAVLVVVPSGLVVLHVAGVVVALMMLLVVPAVVFVWCRETAQHHHGQADWAPGEGLSSTGATHTTAVLD